MIREVLESGSERRKNDCITQLWSADDPSQPDPAGLVRAGVIRYLQGVEGEASAEEVMLAALTAIGIKVAASIATIAIILLMKFGYLGGRRN